MSRPETSDIHDCAALREACSNINQVPEAERDQVKRDLMSKSLELDCPDSIPDDWRVRIGKDYE